MHRVSDMRLQQTALTPAFERWEDLLPPERRQGDVYSQLSPDQLADLAGLARMVRLLAEGKADAGGSMARSADRVREAFRRDGLDADWLLSRREIVRLDRIRGSQNPKADGQPVRLLGIVAPLSQDGNGAREFLLTASLGRCSHVPPPPFSQVAQVRAEEPFDLLALTKEQGTPDPWVWVQGTIRYGVSSHLVYRGDGMLRIDSAYSIEPVSIVPADAAELAQKFVESHQETRRRFRFTDRRRPQRP